jgi:hypothetical protein
VTPADISELVPEGVVVFPAARAVTIDPGPSWGLPLALPIIVEYRHEKTDTRTNLEAWIR